MIFKERVHDFIRHVILYYICTSIFKQSSSTVCAGFSGSECFIPIVLAEDFKSFLCMDGPLLPSGSDPVTAGKRTDRALEDACGNLLGNKRINNKQ